MNHGFRRFFNTALMNSEVNYEFKELLMGHSVNLDDFYYDDENEVSQNKVLAEYMKAIDFLTISNENRLKAENQALKAREKFEIKSMQQQIDVMKDLYDYLSKTYLGGHRLKIKDIIEHFDGKCPTDSLPYCPHEHKSEANPRNEVTRVSE